MRILIIGPGKLKYMPYLHFYLDNLDWSANDIHVAYWNRDEKPEDISAYIGLTLHEFKCFMMNDVSLKEKFQKSWKFRVFCKSILNNFIFDRLIILHTPPGIMLLDVLVRRFKYKYIFDYRDSTYENYFFYRYMVGMMVQYSQFTFVSSDSFRMLLPAKYEKKILTSHNLLEESLNHRDYKKLPSDKIRLAFWGFIRDVEVNRTIIDRISADNRFELHYYGREQMDALQLKQYVHEINASNIFFHGEYIPVDRYAFIRNTDLIHNTFNRNNPNMSKAMSNKYYDSIIFRIPQVCQCDSFMGLMCEKKGVGITLDPCDKDYCQQLYDYYKSLDREFFNRNCNTELERVLSEYNSGKAIIKEFVG